MVTVCVHLSNFSARWTRGRPRPVRIELSAEGLRGALQSRPLVATDEGGDGRLSLPGWSAQWEEHVFVDNDLQRRGVCVALREADGRRWRARRMRSGGLASGERLEEKRRDTSLLGCSCFDLYTLATGTVRQKINLECKGRAGRVEIAFNARVEERRNVEVSLTDVMVCSAYALSAAYVVVSVKGTLSRAYVLSPERHARKVDPEWSALPALSVERCTLAELAHSVLVLKVHEAGRQNRCVGEIHFHMREFWGAVLRSAYAAPFYGELRTPNGQCSTGSVRGIVRIGNVPHTAQMRGGYTVDGTMFDARPVIYGALMPSLYRLNPPLTDVPTLPDGWVQLVDTFGHKFYYNVPAKRCEWIKPGGAGDPDRDSDATLHDSGFERTRFGFFRSLTTGRETWVHPFAEIVPHALPDDSRLDNPRPDDSRLRSSSSSSPGSSFVLSFSAPVGNDDDNENVLRNAAAENGVQHERNSAERRSEVYDSANEDDEAEPDPVSEDSSTESGDPPRARHGVQLCDENGCATEMKWIRLRSSDERGAVPGPGNEGHTLTSMQNGHMLIKFGGLTTSCDKNNIAYSFNPDTMLWSTLCPIGQPPVRRAGHGAVCVGRDQSRLLVFGGSSRYGRLNDVHILDTNQLEWTTVETLGTPPEVRSRLGMTASSSGDVAYVFGGRSMYRYLGGKYYDTDVVHSFNLERSRWSQIKVQGSGARPAPRSGCALEYMNHRQLFLFGGYDDGDKYYSDTYFFDLLSCSWQQIPYPKEPTVPIAREGHACVSMPGSSAMLIYGGCGESGDYLNDLHLFDASRMRWIGSPVTTGYAPGRLCGGRMAAIDDSRVVLAGGDNGFAMTREAYSLDVAHVPLSEVGVQTEIARQRGFSSSTCVVCMDNKVDTMFMWCGHTVCCRHCAERLNEVCPLCRRPFVKIVRDVAAE